MPKLQILIVEDDAFVASALQEKVVNMGFVAPQISPAEDDAITQAARLNPQLILMDKGMLDGVLAAVTIRSSRSIPVVFLTAGSDEHKLPRAQAAEPYGFLLTPFKETELRTTLQIALQDRSKIRRMEDDRPGDGTSPRGLGTSELYEKVANLDSANADLIERNAFLNDIVSRLQAALAEKTLLLKEVHHRVKNNLAVIAGMLNMEAEECGSQQAETALQVSQQRVRSIAMIHEQLHGSEHPDRIDFAAFAHQLTAELYRAFVAKPELVKVRVDAEPIELDVEQAMPCGLILNELLMNAFKYAFVRGRQGEVIVGFREKAPGKVVLSVQDDGVGMATDVDPSKFDSSLGLKIVHILTKQLGATIELDQHRGTRFELMMDLAKVRNSGLVSRSIFQEGSRNISVGQ